MANTETIELHLPYEVMVCCDSNSIAQGGVTSLTLAMLNPVTWYMGLYWRYRDMRYRTSCNGEVVVHAD